MNDRGLTHADGRPYGMGRRSYVRMMDTKRWLEWVREKGGEEGAIEFVFAQVANDVPLPVICEHYGLDYGFLWGLVSSRPEWLERYYLAQRGVAEYYMSEVVPIADGADPDAVNHAKLRIDTRLKVAGKWNRERYGDSDAVLGAGLENLAAVLQRISERKLRVINQQEISDVLPSEEIERQETSKAGVLDETLSEASGVQGGGGEDCEKGRGIEGGGVCDTGECDSEGWTGGKAGESETGAGQEVEYL